MNDDVKFLPPPPAPPGGKRPIKLWEALVILAATLALLGGMVWVFGNAWKDAERESRYRYRSAPITMEVGTDT